MDIDVVDEGLSPWLRRWDPRLHGLRISEYAWDEVSNIIEIVAWLKARMLIVAVYDASEWQPASVSPAVDAMIQQEQVSRRKSVVTLSRIMVVVHRALHVSGSGMPRS